MNKDISKDQKASVSKDKNKSVIKRIKKFFLQMINVIVETVSTILANIMG